MGPCRLPAPRQGACVYVYDQRVCHEIVLEGGNAAGAVVRVGRTVRKPSTPYSAGVQSYMRALRQRGVDLPSPLGFDEQGRSVTEYVAGQLAIDAPALSAEQLREVGGMVRSIHDASHGLDAAELGLGPALIPTPASNLVCHGDLTPWNLVLGERWVFIDWDGSAASTRTWDLAYSTQAFTLNNPETDPRQAAADLRAFVEGYHADPALRSALLEALPQRAQAMYDLLEQAHRQRLEPWGSMFTNGHGTHWSRATQYVEQHDQIWRAALASR